MGIARNIMDKIINRFRGSPTKGMTEEDFAEWLGIGYRNKSELREVTYYTCMKILSETMGKLPIKVYEWKKKQGRVRADPDSTSKLLNGRPNPHMTPSIFFATVENNRNHFGNGYVWIQRKISRNGSENIGLWIMQSDCVTPIYDNTGIFGGQGKIYYQYTDPLDGEMYVFPEMDVMHLKTSMTLDGLTGIPVRDMLGYVVEGASQSQQYMSNLYKGGMTASMALQYAGEIDDSRIKLLQKKYDKYLSGPKNAGKIVPVPAGMQLQPLNYKLTDAQFFELKKYSALQIAGAFGVKPNQINDYEKSSYANSEMQQLSFLVDTMLFPLKQYEEELTYKLYIGTEKSCKFNEKAILRTDSKTQMEILAQGVQNGMRKVNEARELLDLPRDPDGDVLLMNGNFIPVKMAGEQYKKGETSA
ncbi:phage portal protein [Lachnospiraceae bacterium AM23-7LB]|jgi:HK97 family phage portal protein|nr:phage portal protein [Lachnospiraceae bacterium AM23-7LB]RHV59618.1 phage portal protein [Lachnospiraceae bacterium OM02-26]